MSAKITAILMTLLVVSPITAQQETTLTPADPGSYRVFTGSGEPVSLETLLREAGSVDVVFLGEIHSDLTGHRLQYEAFRSLVHIRSGTDEPTRSSASSRGRRTLLSLEMFDRDVQYILDEYLADLITEEQLKSAARPWRYYDEDYAPVVKLAKAAGIPVIAANAPRRYVNMVSRNGPEVLAGLSAEGLRHLPPLPYAPPSEAYRAELEEIMGEHSDSMPGPPPLSEKTLQAQALWDATMAYSIAEALLRHPGALVVHLVGSFHVRNGTGIPEQLARYRPGTTTLIVFVEPVDELDVFPDEFRGAGDFVILTDKAKVRADQRTGSTGQN